jgi:hypothetical protein
VPCTAGLCRIGGPLGHVHEGVLVDARTEYDRSSVASVASVGAPFRGELLAPEADAALAAISSANNDMCLVNEHTRMPYA